MEKVINGFSSSRESDLIADVSKEDPQASIGLTVFGLDRAVCFP